MHPRLKRAGERHSPETPVRVLYVMGCGRSGSTVLDTLLGNHAEIESVGEVCQAPWKAWQNSEYCACGKEGESCEFWGDIHEGWRQRIGADPVQEFAAMTREFEARRLWLPALVREARRPQSRFSQYLQMTGALMEAIREVSGKTLIVDSSKRPARALILSMIPQVDLRVVHLVRDFRGVAWSGKKRFVRDEKRGVTKNDPGKTVLRMAAVWGASNVLSSWVRRKIPSSHSIRIRYEDYVTKPEDALRQIGQLIEMDMSVVIRAVAAQRPMQIGHTIAGNRLRMSGEVRLRPDTEWISKLSDWDRRQCWALTGWLMRLYGYRKHPQIDGEIRTRRAA